MPVSAVPTQFLSDTIVALRQQLDELTRAVGRPTTGLRDGNDNVLEVVEGSAWPVLRARGQGAALVLSNSALFAMDEIGRNAIPIVASTVYGALSGDSTGVHHGDVGSPTEAHNHYGDCHGNTYGFHYGAVGDGSTQYQINALNVFSTGHFGTQHGDVGVGGDNWALFGHVIAPSELSMKTAVREMVDAGDLIDRVPAYRWRWRDGVFTDAGEPGPSAVGTDTHEHAGPAVDDLAVEAPWLVRRHEGTTARGYGDRDLIGVLWAALRESRTTIADLTGRVQELERRTDGRLARG